MEKRNVDTEVAAASVMRAYRKTVSVPAACQKSPPGAVFVYIIEFVFKLADTKMVVTDTDATTAAAAASSVTTTEFYALHRYVYNLDHFTEKRNVHSTLLMSFTNCPREAFCKGRARLYLTVFDAPVTHEPPEACEGLAPCNNNRWNISYPIAKADRDDEPFEDVYSGWSQTAKITKPRTSAVHLRPQSRYSKVKQC
ncbi:hypothetical protein CBL_08157 [Carabus blaptoides fortunei]